MGGHAPIVGAELYIFQAGATGYFSVPTNEMSSGQQGTDSTYGKYILTGPGGSFNITSDYSCTAGHPVYLAAVGGTATLGASLLKITATSVSSKVVTFTAGNSLVANAKVSFASGAFTSSTYTFLNNTTQTVMSATTTSFKVTVTGSPSGSTTGYALAGGLPNPAIVNIAVLGNCPSGTFTNLSFILMNEVSTIAAANALNAFGTGFYAIGATNSNLAGIAAAATNAGQLYNPNSSALGSGVALATTNYVGGGNGVVPQATLDTLGNILAACVDSANAAGNASSSCTALFATATSTGDTTGTKPTDTASAAFNIAAFPAGTGTQHGTFPGKLFALQGSTSTPFQPSLSAAPNDFGIAIVFNNTLNTHVGNMGSLAVDSAGQIWTAAQGDNSITLWSTVGKVVASNSSGYAYGSISIDSANDAYVGNSNSSTPIQKYSSAGTLTASLGSAFQSAHTVIASASSVTTAQVYLFAGATVQTGSWYSSAGVLSSTYAVSNYPITHGASDNSGDLYLTSDSGNQISRVLPSSASGFAQQSGFPITGPTVSGATYQPMPEVPALDATNNAYIPIQSTYSQTGSSPFVAGMYRVSSSGVVTSYYSGTGTNTATAYYTGASLYQTYGAAVDGTGNIWLTNRNNAARGGTAGAPGASTITELAYSSGVAISPSTNYTYGGVLNDPINLAIDISGNIWVTNYGGSSLVEIFGAASPVVAPFSVAANNGTLGKQP